MTRRHDLLRLAAAAGLGASGASAQSTFPEVEPNEAKLQATPVTLAPGDALAGNTVGNSLAPGPDSYDYFLVQTVPAATAIYRHRLLFTSPTPGNSATIRGLAQSQGIIQPIETGLQTTFTTTTPPTYLQWYGFGRQERLYIRVAGTAASTADYTATLQSDTVTPATLGPFLAGTITISTVGRTGPMQTDTDLWVYDSALHAIPGWGNDDESTGTSNGSRLVRTFTPGTYFLALSNFNVANDQPSPSDDGFRFGAVLDFEGGALNSNIVLENVGFAVTDSAATVTVPASKTSPYEILWYKLIVTAAPPPCYPNCDGSTQAPALNLADFTCFLQRFAASDPYANCDASSTPPTLNFIDFACFLQKFAAGC